MSITTSIENEISQKLGIPSSQTIDMARDQVLEESTKLNIIIGLGAGAAPAIIEANSRNEITFVFEGESNPGGKLHNVAAEKPHLKKGTETILNATSKPNVYTFFNTKISLSPGDEGIPLSVITGKVTPSRVMFATGTIEKHIKTPNENDYSTYDNHRYAYELTRTINDHITRGERLGTLELDFNTKGDAVIIVGAGLVGLEDLPASILAWQIDRLLLENSIESPEGFNYLNFTAKPRKYLREMYKEIVTKGDKSSAAIQKLFDLDFDKLSDEEFAQKLRNLGIKETLVLYRGTENDIINKPGSTIKAGALVALPKINLFTLLTQTTISKIKTSSSEIVEVTLNTKDGESETIKTALIIHSIGGTAPNVVVEDQPLDTTKPFIGSNGTVYTHLGNVIKQLGNMAAAIEQSEGRLKELPDQRELPSVTSTEIINLLATLAEQGIVPANPLCTVLSTYPKYLLQKWGWIDTEN